MEKLYIRESTKKKKKILKDEVENKSKGKLSYSPWKADIPQLFY